MLKISRCRSCDARGVWMLTSEGKNILVEAESIDEADLEFDGATGKPLFNQKAGHEAHFANCPDAAKWRKPK